MNLRTQRDRIYLQYFGNTGEDMLNTIKINKKKLIRGMLVKLNFSFIF